MEATGDIRKVSLWFGHASIQSTEIYLRSDPGGKLDVLAARLLPAIRKGLVQGRAGPVARDPERRPRPIEMESDSSATGRVCRAGALQLSITVHSTLMSEMELSTLRHRSEEALRRKAGRGELFMTVAVGYVRVDRDRIGMDPDQRVREAVALVFRKFAELGSIRQVHLWLRHEGIELPALVPGGSAQRIEWKLPVYNSIHHMLTNPVYAGAYAFGRTGTRTYLENGHKRVVHGIRRRRDEWEVLIRDHHDGYITWAEYERNQKVIADNANCQGAAARGSIRQGEALLAGLVRCGHCGRNLHVTYPGDQRSMARYACRGGHVNHGTELCISFGGLRVDRAVGEAVLHVLRPLGIEAALKAIEERRRASCEVLRQAELALEAARFEEQHARRQYDAVDPDNRLVASELERRWNERLEVVRQREEAVSALLASREQEVLGPDETRRVSCAGRRPRTGLEP